MDETARASLPESRRSRDTEPLEERLRPAGRTLLVCADPLVLAPGRTHLERAGFEICPAGGWSEALALSQSIHPGVALVDGAFLDGSGPQLCAALRRTWGRVEVPVLALCGGRREVRRAFDAGASDVVEKPPNWEVVGRRLASLYQGFRASTELEQQRALFQESHREVAQAWDRLERQRLTDALTGLPNRTRLDEIVARALIGARRNRESPALLFLDIDRFTEINETLGRRAGDEVLRQVASRLAGHLRSSPRDVVLGPGLTMAARLSGDEFALMLTEVLEPQALVAFADGLIKALSAAFRVGDTEVYLSASVGVAVSGSSDGESAEALLQHAETAMHEAKRRGGGCCQVYSDSLTGAAEVKLGLDRRLRGAFERKELMLHYQPVLESGRRRLLGVEALLRWHDPERGWISPSEFVPVAEDTGLMTAIGAWVLEQACRQLKAWIDDGLPPIRMAVNISRCQLERGDLAADLQRVLEQTGLEPGLLELEISERGALRSDPTIVAQLRRIKALGVRLVVDDFGTGQSAIAYLRQFPLDGLKIDGSFVRGTVVSEDDAAITSAIVAMAHRLRLEVVAEGVETKGQMDLMKQYGCEAIQGFLFSRALAADKLREAVTCDQGGAWLAAAPGAAS